ncbi:thioredoxin [Corchorus olitorius]|uniref:Thioredoxin n=1 Tax=Corchorus olitorius TaxID=93759 RepID=A0A1R3GF91_9ROSI|nr:thioredoxin [Corchorus olitorius]
MAQLPGYFTNVKVMKRESDEANEALQNDEINQAPTVIIIKQVPQLFDPKGIKTNY